VRVIVLVGPVGHGVHIVRHDTEVGPLGEGDTVDLTDVIADFCLAVTEILARIRPA
jgi:hypothetical protein